MEVLMAVITSLIASIIFYLVFQFIPERKKRNKIRPRVEIELTEIADQLFFYLEIPLHYDLHFASQFQDGIKNGSLSAEDYELYLYNKCLNNSYLYDRNKSKLIVCGHKLREYTDQTSEKIHQVMLNQNYLSAEEILIIEDINRLLHTYDYDWSAVDEINGMKLYPVNPTISYMSENFHKLQDLYIDLRNILFKCEMLRKETRQGRDRYFSLQSESAIYEISKHNYDKAKKILFRLSNIGDWSDFQISVIKSLLLRVDVETGELDHAEDLLKQVLEDPSRDKLVYHSGYLECIRDCPQLMDICKALCSKDEIDEWNKTVESEKTIKDKFIERNRELKEYYETISGQPVEAT